MKLLLLAAVILAIPGQAVHAQKRAAPRSTPSKIPASVPVKKVIASDPSVGRTYTNASLGFRLTFPSNWMIPDKDFEATMKKQGFDLSLKAPDTLPPVTRAQVNRAVQNVEVLLTAYRSMPGSAENAIVRISIEDLTPHPQIRDAVDYFDAIRASFESMKLPEDMKYSETQAERLGAMQFGFLDVSNKAGKKRMYATVRDRRAVQFTLSYTRDEDLETFRRVLAEGDFKVPRDVTKQSVRP